MPFSSNKSGTRPRGVSRMRIPLLVFVLLFLSGLFSPVRPLWDNRQGAFTAYWSVSGTVHILEFINSGTVASGRLRGNLVIQTDKGQVPAFETDCVAFADDRSGSMSRCVWTDIFGNKIYCELKGSGPAGFGSSRGTFIGGTGKFEGIQGGFSFQWNFSMGSGEDTILDAHTMQMNGQYQLAD